MLDLNLVSSDESAAEVEKTAGWRVEESGTSDLSILNAEAMGNEDSCSAWPAALRFGILKGVEDDEVEQADADEEAPVTRQLFPSALANVPLALPKLAAACAHLVARRHRLPLALLLFPLLLLLWCTYHPRCRLLLIHPHHRLLLRRPQRHEPSRRVLGEQPLGPKIGAWNA